MATKATTIPLKVGPSANLEITKDLAHQMNWQSGEVKIVPQNGSLLVVPKDVPDDELWFWSPEWQQKEREADEDIAAGDVSGPFNDAEELISHLNSQN